MGQQSSLSLPTVIAPKSVNFIPQIHQFQSSYIQRLKQTPFIGSICYNSQPSIYVESSQMTLQSLLAPRMSTSKLFPKQEILKIIDNILSGLIQLKSRKFQSYGNFCLSSIFYHKQTKTFKLINPAFFNFSNYSMVVEGIRFNFLAPEQLLNLIGQNHEETRSFKTDIFIFAICLLQVCTLEDSRQIYCPQTYNILDPIVQERLKIVEEFYSLQLVRFLSSCLQYEIQKRLDLQTAIRQIRLLKDQENSQNYVSNSHFNMVKPTQTYNTEPKKATLPFGPGNLPKKLQTTN